MDYILVDLSSKVSLLNFQLTMTRLLHFYGSPISLKFCRSDSQTLPGIIHSGRHDGTSSFSPLKLVIGLIFGTSKVKLILWKMSVDDTQIYVCILSRFQDLCPSLWLGHKKNAVAISTSQPPPK